MPSKLTAVIRHEYLTIVKQPVFWLIMLLIPALLAVVMTITTFSNREATAQIEEAAKDLQNVTVIDQSGLINRDIAAQSQIQFADPTRRDELIADVKDGELSALIVYPDDLTATGRYAIYANTTDGAQSGVFTQVGDSLLRSSLYAPLGDQAVIALAQNGAEADVTTYRNGELTAGIREQIVPAVIFGLFYLILVFSVNYMLTSVSEEKENRSMEMVLSYVKPRTLIFGKLLGISLVTLTQLAFLGAVAAIAFFTAQSLDIIPSLPAGFDLSAIVFDPVKIIFGMTILVLGFLLFSALMAGAGSIVPSAKDAGGLSFAFIAGALIPLYVFSLLVNDSDSPITQFLTYFPLSAPTTLLIRNAFGQLSTFEMVLATALLTVFTVLSIFMAAALFKRGALEFTNRLSLKALIGRG